MPKNSDDQDLFAGALDVMILHSLRLKPMHGYALVKHIKKVSDDLLQIEQSLSTPPYDACSRRGCWIRRRHFSHQPSNSELPAQRRQHQALEKARSSFEKRLAGISRVIAVQ